MGLKVNFSQDEAESTAREVLPTGAYPVAIVDVETREVKPGSANVGKPYWSIRFVVQDGNKYAGNSVFANIMLFSTEKSGTLSTLSQFLKALGYEITPGEFEIPDNDEIQGKLLTIVGRKLPAGPDRKTGKELPERFNVNAYKKMDVSTTKSTSNSMLP